MVPADSNQPVPTMMSRFLALLALLAAGAMLAAVPATAADTDVQLSADDRRVELKGFQDIDLSVTVDGDPACDVTEAKVRAAVTERMVAAGMKIDVASLVVVRVSVNVLHAKASDLCIAQRSVITTKFAGFESAGSDKKHGYVVLRIDEGLSTSDPTKVDFILRTIGEGMNGTIDVWRAANAGAPFVRPAATTPAGPAAAPAAPVVDGVSMRTVQQRLSDLGLFRGAVDGTSGPATRLAIQRFQRTNELPATGDLDRDTLRKLFP
jgi:hypothetical protein